MSVIKRIEIKNWLGLSEFAVDLGKINILTGRKGSGKTSLIEAIEKAFTNKNRRDEVIRHGEDEATIFVRLDDGLEVDRKVRADKSDYLKVKKEGHNPPSTEKFLKSLINGEIFRPLEFINKTPEEQTKIILNMLEIPWGKNDIENWFSEVPEGINYEAHILVVLKQIEELYYNRREAINREIKVLEAQVQGIKNDLPSNYDGDIWRKKSVQELYAKVAEADEINKKVLAAKNVIDNLEDRISSIKSAAESAKKDKKAEFESQRSEIKEYKQFLVNKIEKSEEVIAQANIKVAEAEKLLELELQNEIKRLEAEYERKKVDARKSIQADVEHRKASISEYKEGLATKEQELLNMDKLEEQSIAKVNELVAEKINTEEAKAGNARGDLLQYQEIDVEPLKNDANEAANMQSYLREFDRMALIIKEKLSPRQEQSQTLSARIKKARELPTNLLKIAAVPIPGITVDGDGKIRIDKTLISGLSEGEQLEFAWKVAKVQGDYGNLKVIVVDGLNKINEADRVWIEQEMQTDDFQHFVLLTTNGELSIETREGIQ